MSDFDVEIHTITDDEAAAFGFGDWDRIQRACGAIIGERPDQWFLHDPTKPHANPDDHRYDNAYGDVFKWQPVTVTLKPTQSQSTYDASLSGSLMSLNFDWYGGHCWRPLDPNDVLSHASLPTTITIRRS